MSLKIWDAQFSEKMQSTEDLKSNISVCAYSPDGSQIATGTDQTLNFLNAETGERFIVYWDTILTSPLVPGARMEK